MICGDFVGIHLSAPETFTVQTYIPVRQIFADEILNGASRRRRVVVVECRRNVADQSVEQRDNPTVDFGTLGNGNLLLLAREAVDVGIEREERIGVVERAEEFATHLIDAIDIEFQIVPRLRVGNHIPACRIGTVAVEYLERIDGIAQSFGHLVAVLVQHQTVGDDIFEGHVVE